MSGQKHYFDEPAVRVELSRVRFPKVCPVCGNSASILSRITLVSGKDRYLLRSWNPAYTPTLSISPRRSLPQPKLRVLPIYVCENHYHSDAGEDRYKSLCFIVDGLAMAFFLFGLFFLADAFHRGRPISFWSLAFSAFFAGSMFLTWIAFRPNALQRAVRIIGFDSGMQNVLIAFKDKSYRDLIIQENPMSSELVSWIVKPDS
ncbi:MAG: hypothetical protein RTV72_08335 [Candidatus Thorarchaeota archaeon]